MNTQPKHVDYSSARLQQPRPAIECCFHVLSLTRFHLRPILQLYVPAASQSYVMISANHSVILADQTVTRSMGRMIFQNSKDIA